MWELPLVLPLVPGIAPLVLQPSQDEDSCPDPAKRSIFLWNPLWFPSFGIFRLQHKTCSADGVSALCRNNFGKKAPNYTWASALCCGCPSLQVLRVRLGFWAICSGEGAHGQGVGSWWCLRSLPKPFCEKGVLTSQVSEPFCLYGDRFRLCPLEFLDVSLQPSL